jgi:hypothetical protein
MTSTVVALAGATVVMGRPRSEVLAAARVRVAGDGHGGIQDGGVPVINIHRGFRRVYRRKARAFVE